MSSDAPGEVSTKPGACEGLQYFPSPLPVPNLFRELGKVRMGVSSLFIRPTLCVIFASFHPCPELDSGKEKKK
jgi:hypothetical protein